MEHLEHHLQAVRDQLKTIPYMPNWNRWRTSRPLWKAMCMPFGILCPC